MKILFKNIKEIVGITSLGSKVKKGKEMSELGRMQNAYLVSEKGKIKSFGAMNDCPASKGFDQVIDADGQFLLPAFVDSHTHLVFAANREGEFEQRIAGMTYEEIAKRGGGILNSAAKLASMSEDELFDRASDRLHQMISNGTGAIEIKSGYGLDTESELKMLRVIRRLGKTFPIPVKSTFLGAHALPLAFKDRKSDYIDLVCNEMLPKAFEEGLVDYVDIFCEDGYFSADDTRRLIRAGKQLGLPAKIHVNQFNSIGGIAVAKEEGALTVDHLEVLTDEDLAELIKSEIMPVALPSCSFFLSIPYTPARKIIDSGLPLVLASDYNPGSTPSGNMWFLWSLACIKMKMLPEEALNALTINGAAALQIEGETGSIEVGKRSNFILTKPADSLAYFPYSFGETHLDSVFINGVKY